MIEAIKRTMIPAVIFSPLIIYNCFLGLHDIPLNTSSKFWVSILFDNSCLPKKRVI
jgi:hypothetical protein